MKYRADESEASNFEQAANYLLNPRYELTREQIESGRDFLHRISDEFGPVIDTYPSWHPFVSCSLSPHSASTRPQLPGLDHTVFFANAILTCPYEVDPQLEQAIFELQDPDVTFSYERPKITLYHPNAMPVLITCRWKTPLRPTERVPSRIAIGRLLEKELSQWRKNDVAETWETMRPYFLGQPCGSRSSLFIDQETGQIMKKTWESFIHSGVFGPIQVLG